MILGFKKSHTTFGIKKHEFKPVRSKKVSPGKKKHIVPHDNTTSCIIREFLSVVIINDAH